MPSAMVLIQEIRTAWTKASRGGAAATLRNRVPEAAIFPAVESKPAADKIFHHRLIYGEADDFAAPVKSETAEAESDRITIGCVKIEVSPEKLVVAYEYDHKCGGAPARRGGLGVSLEEELIVERGRWARVKYNGRFTGDEWWYEKLVVNVGLFERYDARAFYSTAPTHEIVRMAELR
jgi:hypothetical protein